MGNGESSGKRKSKRSVYNTLTPEESFHQKTRKKSTFEEMPVSPRPQSQSKSQKKHRYEGLEAAQHVSLDSRRVSISRQSERRPRAGSLALVKDNHELILDVSPKKNQDHDLPPPPIPSEEEHNEIMNQASSLSQEDLDFVDYTIVPLLLRSSVDYESADKFGRILKLKYSNNQIRSLMKTPYGLFAVLQKEKILISDEVKFDIVEDKFWQNADPKDENADGSRRRGNSFVYYRDTSSSSKAMQQKTDSRPQMTPQSHQTQSNRERRRSIKNEFEQKQIKTTEDEKSGFDLKVLRQSLKILGNDFFTSNDDDDHAVEKDI